MFEDEPKAYQPPFPNAWRTHTLDSFFSQSQGIWYAPLITDKEVNRMDELIFVHFESDL